MISTFHITVIVGEGGLISFGRIYSYLEGLGYYPEREDVRIEGWLVQFVFACESVQEEAVERADRFGFAGAYTSVFSVEHLAAELLRSGGPKDIARVVALLESEQMSMNILAMVAI